MDEFVILADRSPDLVADIGFEPAFELTLHYGRTQTEQTPRGKRIFRPITGGTISGKIEGTVYPRGAGEYSIGRDDGVTDISEHVLVRDTRGEWLYIRNMGYERADGYYRVTSWVDADVRSQHNWVLGLFFLGVAIEHDDGKVTLRYYEVL
ncbi:MAG: DUF3237 family protein [Croceibacterium sp.]